MLTSRKGCSLILTIIISFINQPVLGKDTDLQKLITELIYSADHHSTIATSSIVIHKIFLNAATLEWPCYHNDTPKVVISPIGGDSCYLCQSQIQSHTLDKTACSYKVDNLCPYSFYDVSVVYESLQISYTGQFTTHPREFTLPTILRPTSTSTSIQVIWADPSCPTQLAFDYLVTISSSSIPVLQPIIYKMGSDTEWRASDLTPGKEYAFSFTTALPEYPSLPVKYIQQHKVTTKDSPDTLSISYDIQKNSAGPVLRVSWGPLSTASFDMDQKFNIQCTEAGANWQEPENLATEEGFYLTAPLKPNTEYDVIVSYVRSEDGKKVSESIFATTNPVPNTPVIIRKKALSSKSVEIKWAGPKHSINLELEYVVKLFKIIQLEPQNQETMITEKTITGQRSVKFEDLTPNRLYKVEIYVKGTNVLTGETTNSGSAIGYVTTLEDIPSVPDRELSLISSGHQNAEFFLPDHLFSNENGDILLYTVIAGIKNKIAESSTRRSGSLNDDKVDDLWQVKIPSMYRASQYLWNPYTDSAKINPNGPFKCKPHINENKQPGRRCTLGTDKCDKEVCNGLLNKKTEYGLKIRGYNKVGWSETSPLYFTTSSVSKAIMNPALITALLLGMVLF